MSTFATDSLANGAVSSPPPEYAPVRRSSTATPVR